MIHRTLRCQGMCPGRIILAIAVLLLAAQSFIFDATAQASDPSIQIVSPAAGAPVTTDDIALQVDVSDFALDCAAVGRPDEAGVGHIHVMVDGMTMAQLINFYCEETITIPGDGLDAGMHTIVVVLSSNSHVDMMETMTQVEFDFQPANAKPLPAAQDLGVPGVELVGMTDGDSVAPVFTIDVQPINFVPSAALEGKRNVPGYGHWHVFVDTPMMGMGAMGDAMATPDSAMAMATPAEGMDSGMAMMSMAGMVAMPGANTFELDLSAWGPGVHTIWIEPVQNDHTMFAEFGHIEFTVVVATGAGA